MRAKRVLAEAKVPFEVPCSVTLLTRLTEDLRALAYLNPRNAPVQPTNAGLAMGLGHLLLDVESCAVAGDGEHWPSAARARAFGVALALPEDGVRALLGGASSVDVDALKALMAHFGTGPIATVRRLENLRFIGAQARDQLLESLTV